MKFSLDKYVALQVRWCGYVREVLKSEEVRKTVKDSCKDGDIIVRAIVSCPATCWVVVRDMIAEQIAVIDDSCGGQ